MEHGKISASDSEFLDGLQISAVLPDPSQVTVKARRPACIIILPCLSLQKEFRNIQCCKAGETAGIFNYFVILYGFCFFFFFFFTVAVVHLWLQTKKWLHTQWHER